MLHVQPEAIDGQQMQLIPQLQQRQATDPDRTEPDERNKAHIQQSSSGDSVGSFHDDEASDASLSLQQLDDQSIATDTTHTNSSRNIGNPTSSSQLPDGRIVWKDLHLGQSTRLLTSPHHLLQLEQVPLPDEASDSTTNSKGPYIKLQNTHTGEEKIMRQGLVFPPLHQDFQLVLWNRSPEEKEVFVHAKENPTSMLDSGLGITRPQKNPSSFIH